MYRRAFSLFLTTLVTVCGLSLLGACSSHSDFEDESTPLQHNEKVASYINLTIAVSNGVENMTRAGEIPTAGENGDGREAGFRRENVVTGITFILYKDATGQGINNTNDNLPIDFIAYYPVSRVSEPAEAGTPYTTKTDEAYYSTGNQLVAKNTIDFNEEHYYAIVIANADLRGQVSTLGDVRNNIMRTLYSGSEKDPAQDCVNFVMSSEENYQFIIPDPVASPAVGGNTLYTIEKPIRVERLAARIDFWAAGSNGYKDTYTTPGYEYNVVGSTDKFVVTGITPFNLNSYDYGNGNGGEYLIKRLAKAVTEPENLEVSYLIDENDNQYKYVLDPRTQYKTSGTLTYFKNSLKSLPATGTTLADITTLSGNPYYKSVVSLHTAVTATGSSAGFKKTGSEEEIVIIAYPMENTLWESSRLYNCATGLAIEGDYYYDGTGTPVHRIFYGYLRHQGSASSYSAILGTEMSSTEATTADNCMEFGIVRNNIYRVSIESITEDFRIKVKLWDKFEHATIYM